MIWFYVLEAFIFVSVFGFEVRVFFLVVCIASAKEVSDWSHDGLTIHSVVSLEGVVVRVFCSAVAAGPRHNLSLTRSWLNLWFVWWYAVDLSSSGFASASLSLDRPY